MASTCNPDPFPCYNRHHIGPAAAAASGGTARSRGRQTTPCCHSPRSSRQTANHHEAHIWSEEGEGSASHHGPGDRQAEYARRHVSRPPTAVEEPASQCCGHSGSPTRRRDCQVGSPGSLLPAGWMRRSASSTSSWPSTETSSRGVGQGQPRRRRSGEPSWRVAAPGLGLSMAACLHARGVCCRQGLRFCACVQAGEECAPPCAGAQAEAAVRVAKRPAVQPTVQRGADVLRHDQHAGASFTQQRPAAMTAPRLTTAAAPPPACRIPCTRCRR